jgi:hypothetical protein
LFSFSHCCSTPSHCWFCFLLGSSMFLFIFIALLLSSSHCCSILHILFGSLRCYSTPCVLVGLLALLFVSSYVVQLFAVLFNPSHCNSTTSNLLFNSSTLLLDSNPCCCFKVPFLLSFHVDWFFLLYLALHINLVLPPTIFMQAQEQGCWNHWIGAPYISKKLHFSLF